MGIQQQIPIHIAIIMDGNRRWAREHGLPILAGHQKVADEIIEPLVAHAAKRGIKYLTFWAFSTENWSRDKKEVEGIMHIFRHVIRKRWQRLHEKGVRIKVIGDISKFAPGIQGALAKVVERTKNNTKITTIFALNYGGRDELIRAIDTYFTLHVSKPIRVMTPSGWFITEGKFRKCLDTKDIPDPDIIVRTGGDQRLSGFLPWQSVYSELYFPVWYMPEFTTKKLDEVIEEYGRRRRRFGK